MLRIILKTVYHNEDLQIHDEVFKTLDIENKSLERMLIQGGCGNGGYEKTSFVGVEVIETDRWLFHLTIQGYTKPMNRESLLK